MNQPLTDQQLTEIRARVAAATEGPWYADGHEILVGTADDITRHSQWIGETCTTELPDWGNANGAFVAHARQDIPALLAEVTRDRAELASLRAELEQTRQQRDEARERLAGYGTPVRGPVAAPPIDRSHEVQQALRALLESGAVPEQHAWVVGKAICPEGAKCPAGITAIFTPTKRGRLPIHRGDYSNHACPGSGRKVTPLKLADSVARPSA